MSIYLILCYFSVDMNRRLFFDCSFWRNGHWGIRFRVEFYRTFYISILADDVNHGN